MFAIGRAVSPRSATTRDESLEVKGFDKLQGPIQTSCSSLATLIWTMMLFPGACLLFWSIPPFGGFVIVTDDRREDLSDKSAIVAKRLPQAVADARERAEKAASERFKKKGSGGKEEGKEVATSITWTCLIQNGARTVP